MPLDFDSIVIRTAGLMSTPVDREIIIMNPARDNYIGLDEIGRRVWDLIEAPGKVEDLCQRMTQEYWGDPRQITTDLLVFLNALAAEGLIHVACA